MDELVPISDTFAALNAVESVTRQIIDEIPSYTDEILENVLISASAMETSGWVIRGCAVNEIQTRLATRLSGGRGIKDVEEVGIGAQIAKLAAKLGKSAKLLESDARIFRRFGAELIEDEDRLDREVYIVALGAGSLAEDVIELAQSKRESPSYTIRNLRSDVKKLCEGVPLAEQETVKWIQVGLDEEEYAELKSKAQHWKIPLQDAAKHLMFGKRK